MSTIHIAVIVGSLRRESFNRKLADAMAKLAPADFSFSQDDDGQQAAPVLRMKAQISAAQGLASTST